MTNKLAANIQSVAFNMRNTTLHTITSEIIHFILTPHKTCDIDKALLRGVLRFGWTCGIYEYFLSHR